MDDAIVDYEFGQLEAGECATVEMRLTSDPVLREKHASLRRLLNRLNADRAVEHDLPPGLALVTIGRVAREIANLPVAAAIPLKPQTWADDRPAYFGWPRADFLVAACLGLLGLGLLLPTIQKYRQRAQTVACQENLHDLHTGLAGYADTNSGRFPQVGSERVPVAGSFIAELTRAGQLPPNVKTSCPGDGPTTEIGYAYSLGYHNRFGELIGPRLPDPESSSETLPIAADHPAPSAHGGWNVLLAGGSVRRTQSPIFGNPNDDLFHNDDRQPRAGLHRFDVSLGRANDRP